MLFDEVILDQELRSFGVGLVSGGVCECDPNH